MKFTSASGVTTMKKPTLDIETAVSSAATYGRTELQRVEDRDGRRGLIKPLERLPSLDGWRALSIILVLGSHCTYAAGFPPALGRFFFWAFDGELGVRTFFIISGFLITWLMLMEHDRTGTVCLSRFYARRALRILPVYVAFLLVLATLQILTPYRQAASAWAANITFTTNFDNVGNFLSGHLWSLAVEEQFYLLWPGLFVLCSVGKNQRAAALILLLPVLVAPCSRVITNLGLAPTIIRPLFSYRSFFNYFDSLAIGCACALLRRAGIAFVDTGQLSGREFSSSLRSR